MYSGPTALNISALGGPDGQHFMRDTLSRNEACLMGKTGLFTIPRPPTFLLGHKDKAVKNCYSDIGVDLTDTSGDFQIWMFTRAYIYRLLWNHTFIKNHLLGKLYADPQKTNKQTNKN